MTENTERYGDTHEERVRELLETGASVRHRSHPGNPEGKGILQLLREALAEDTDAARRSCSCGEGWADEPGHDDDAAQAPVCILTGQDGENPDDCTTHEHEH